MNIIITNSAGGVSTTLTPAMLRREARRIVRGHGVMLRYNVEFIEDTRRARLVVYYADENGREAGAVTEAI